MPLTCIPGDRAYVAEAALDLVGDAEGGLLLFYNPKAFVGIYSANKGSIVLRDFTYRAIDLG